MSHKNNQNEKISNWTPCIYLLLLHFLHKVLIDICGFFQELNIPDRKWLNINDTALWIVTIVLIMEILSNLHSAPSVWTDWLLRLLQQQLLTLSYEVIHIPVIPKCAIIYNDVLHNWINAFKVCGKHLAMNSFILSMFTAKSYFFESPYHLSGQNIQSQKMILELMLNQKIFSWIRKSDK